MINLEKDKKLRNVIVSLDLNGHKNLADLMKKNIVFFKQIGAELIWKSIATDKEKEELASNWKSLILPTIKKYFGEVKVKNLPVEADEKELEFLARAIELFEPKKVSF